MILPTEESHLIQPAKLENWMQDIQYSAAAVEVIHDVKQIQEIVQCPSRYPSPVRVKGSHHSVTNCIVAEGGTVVDMGEFNEILSIDRSSMTITMQAGVLEIDAAKALEKEGLQLFLNLEIGNLTMGSAACCGTKDSSFYKADGTLEHGQQSSYCCGMKVVLPDGSIKEISDESDPELMRSMRNSYGLLGIIYEVTFRIKPMETISVKHKAYSLEELEKDFDKLLASKQSLNLFIYPFINRIVVEMRTSTFEDGQKRLSNIWALRNFAWQYVRPIIGNLLNMQPFRFIQNIASTILDWITVFLQVYVVRATKTAPASQVIRYPEHGGLTTFTFSFWAFPVSKFLGILREYFDFVKQFDKENGYRCEILAMGYLVGQDDSNSLSYCSDEPIITIDPGATGKKKWFEFLDKYNVFCSERGGRPLFNQTPRLTAEQAAIAYGPKMKEFWDLRKEIDSEDRFLNDYFRYMYSYIQ